MFVGKRNWDTYCLLSFLLFILLHKNYINLIKLKDNLILEGLDLEATNREDAIDYYISILDHDLFKNDYYVLFLTLMKKLFEKQIEFNRYNKTTSPILISEINRYFSKNNIYIQT